MMRMPCSVEPLRVSAVTLPRQSNRPVARSSMNTSTEPSRTRCSRGSTDAGGGCISPGRSTVVADGAPMRRSSAITNRCVPATWKLTSMSAAAAESTSVIALAREFSVRPCGEAGRWSTQSAVDRSTRACRTRRLASRTSTCRDVALGSFETVDVPMRRATGGQGQGGCKNERATPDHALLLDIRDPIVPPDRHGRRFVTQVDSLRPRNGASRGRGSILRRAKCH